MTTSRIVDPSIQLAAFTSLATLLAGAADARPVVGAAIDIIEALRSAPAVSESSGAIDEALGALAADGADMAVVGDTAVVVRAMGLSIAAFGERAIESVSLDDGHTLASAATDTGPIPGAGVGGAAPTRYTLVVDGVVVQDVTTVGGAVVQDHATLPDIEAEISEAMAEAFEAGRVAYEETEADAEEGGQEYTSMVESQGAGGSAGAPVGPAPSTPVPEVTGGPAPGPDGGVGGPGVAADPVPGGARGVLGGAERLIAGAVVTGGAAIAREAMRRRRDGHQEMTEQQDSAESAPETGPSAVPLTREVSDGGPNHYVGPEGTTVGSVVSGSAPSVDLAGQVVRRIEDSDSGWTLVECLNGARCWVDPTGLTPFAAPAVDTSRGHEIEATPAPEPVQQPKVEPEPTALYWFYVNTTVQVQLGDGSVIGQLEPGAWYPAHEESGGWARTLDAAGHAGWVPAHMIQRA